MGARAPVLRMYVTYDAYAMDGATKSAFPGAHVITHPWRSARLHCIDNRAGTHSRRDDQRGIVVVELDK
jgi:hypothetical protein